MVTKLKEKLRILATQKANIDNPDFDIDLCVDTKFEEGYDHGQADGKTLLARELLKLLEEPSELEFLQTSITEILKILKTTEQTDDGREFHPTTIQSCRVLDAEKLQNIFRELEARLLKP